jgi:hypothetical protein
LIKIILLTLLLIYISVRIGGFIFRTMFWMLGARSGVRNAQRPTYGPTYANGRSRREGEVHVEHIPEEEIKKRRAGFNGGEYVDYEEVK